MKLAILTLATLSLTGCFRTVTYSNGETANAFTSRWNEERVPTTDAERTAIASTVEKLLAATPKTLSGHDQDWDDAIAAAFRGATQVLCRPTMWEYQSTGFAIGDWRKTGRWYYVDEPKTIHGN